MNQEWFEMNDIRRKNYSRSVWIPLRAVFYNERVGKKGYEGYKKDFFGTGSIAIPADKLDAANKLGWMNIGIRHEHPGRVEDGVYVPADIYKEYGGKFEGIHLVLEQRFGGDSPKIWHLNQDLVITLGLIREGNSWLCHKDGYTEVARLKIYDDGAPFLLEVKSQYLRDYLCARGLALYMTHYFSRDVVCDDASHIAWQKGSSNESNEQDSWKGSVIEIHEGGHPFGKKMSVSHVVRTDVDESEDVPDISGLPTDGNTHGESWEKEFEGRKLYRISGELWRNEILMPGASSPKVRGDETDPTVFFIIDVEGNRSCGRDLIDTGKWLWFKPDLMMALSHRRGGHLSFYTEQTGTVSCSGHEYCIHFGVNEIGLINVYAEDVGLLPEWQQQIWAGYNISPEGGVSAELLASQVRADPASTMAPEMFLPNGIDEINKFSQDKLGIKLLRDHEAVPELIKKVHRFRSVDESSLYALAKDVSRLIADRLDTQAMHSIVAPPKKENWGSIKSLENLLASKYNRTFIRKVTAPLVGVYELRHADAHLPSSKSEEAYKLIEIDRESPFVHQGFQMLHHVVSSVYGIAEGLRRWK